MNRKKHLILLFPFFIIVFLIAILLKSCVFSTDARFSSYTSELFRQEVSSNAITLHYTLSDPSKYQIHDSPVSFGQVSTNPSVIGASAENALSRLHVFDRDRLSEENQLLYDLLEENYSSAMDMAPYTLYEEPLSPLTGTQAQLPVLLSEYAFHSLNDVNTYLALLRELPAYFQSILEFEQAKAAAGLFMSDERALAVIEECEAFVEMGDSNYLHATFEKRLQKLADSEELSDSRAFADSGAFADSEAFADSGTFANSGAFANSDEYEQLISQNARCIEDSVFPAYELLARGMNELLGSCKNPNGLCHFPDGKTYYEFLVGRITGSDRSIMEMKVLTLNQIITDIEDMQKALAKFDANLSAQGDTQADTVSEDDLLVDSNPRAVLLALKEKLAGSFPVPPDVDIDVRYVDASMADYLSPAFFLIPTIDNYSENTIYINPKHITDDLSLFTTLAHEGYPGHLYQTTYYSAQNPPPLRSLLDCGSYTEGWATYCEMMSYYWTPLDKESATLLQKNSSVMLGLYAYADMGIHHDGWSLDDTVAFFEEYGIYDAAAVRSIFDLIVGDPGNYLKYYIGYLEFLELKKDAIAVWGNGFTQERFHREVLEMGPVPFRILREKMQLGTG